MLLLAADPLLAFNQLTWLAGAGFAGGLYLFVRGFRLLARKRFIINTPTSKIRSASMGLLEVSGAAGGPYTLRTPIAGIPCFLYRTTVWQRNDESRSREWKIVAEETLHVPFYLDDGTGKLLIHPQGAELDLRRDFHQDYSDTIFSPHATPETMSFLARHGIASENEIRVEECAIRPQSQLFIVGTLAENPGIDLRPGPDLNHRGTTPIEAALNMLDAPEVIRLSEPAGASNTQQAKIAAALSKAGITNPAAWAAAGVRRPPLTALDRPHISQIEINRSDSVPNSEAQPEYDLAPPVVLMKGKNDPSFLISWHSQRDLVRSLAWKSAAMIWCGAGLALLAIYVVLMQMGMA